MDSAAAKSSIDDRTRFRSLIAEALPYLHLCAARDPSFALGESSKNGVNGVLKKSDEHVV
jgi:hypothetical protein